MKKQITTSTEQNETDLRRSTRNRTVNKLSKSRKRTALIDPSTETQNTETLAVGPSSTKTTFKEISPIKKQLPIIIESPSPRQLKTKSSSITSNDNANDFYGKNHDNLVTPKSNKTHSFTESTPFKEDLLACSQHFDPQSDVAWDCRSPDAINFLKRSRRRRHHSDVHVSEIVTQLQVCKEGLSSEAPDSGDTPLLGLWVNDESCWNGLQLQEKKRPVRERRRKERSKTKAKVNNGEDALPKDLVEKLQLVIEQCEGKEDDIHKNTVDSQDPIRSASVGDESKDLFDITSQCDRNKDYPSDSWSDDDLFENDSFIIKATQVENVPKCNKRKHEQKTSDEPPVKTGKYLENQSAVSGLSSVRFTRLSAKPSPFKKHKSFNDRSEYEKSQQQNFTPLRCANQQTRNCSKQSNSGFSQSRNCKPGAISTQQCNNVNKSNSQNIYNLKQSVPRMAPVTTASTYVTASNCGQRVPSSTKSSMSYSTNNGASSSFTNQGVCKTGQGSNNTRFGIIPTSTQSVSLSRQTSVNTAGNCTVTVSKPCISTTRSHTATKPASPPKTLSKEQNNGCEKTTVTGLQTPGSRRSSGAFDMSLSDDILCQLVEPDEILDSQMPVKTNSIESSHIDDALSFFHEEPKPKIEKVHSNKSAVKTQSLNIESAQTTTGSLVSKSSTYTFKSDKKQNMVGFQGNQPNSDTTSNWINNQRLDIKKPLSIKQEVKSCTVISNVSAIPTTGHSVSKPLTNSKLSINKEQIVDYKPNMTKKSEPPEGTKMYSFRSTTVKTEPADDIDIKSQKKSKDGAMENASEDLFTSDDDDLSEPQLLALLDTVESTQTNPAQSSAPKNRKQSPAESVRTNFRGKSCQLDKELTPTPRNVHTTSQLNIDTKLCTLTPTKSQPSKSPFKCSPEDIDRKRQEALKRRRVVSGNIQHQTVPTTNKIKIDEEYHHSDKTSNSSWTSFQSVHKPHHVDVSKLDTDNNSAKNNSSPLTCSQEEIEKKKQEALQRLQQKTTKNTSDDNRKSSWDSSPFKCTPEMPSHSQPTKSPFKCSPEDIEKKRLAAINLKQQKTNVIKTNSVSGNSNNSQWDASSIQLTPQTPTKSQIPLSPVTCSPEDIEKKRQAAMQRRQQRLGKNSSVKNDHETGNSETNSSKFSPDKHNIASKCKQLNFDELPSKKETTKFKGVTINALKSKPEHSVQVGSSSTNQGFEKVNLKKESPCKYSQAEIEQKKQAALQRRLEKMKEAQKLK